MCHIYFRLSVDQLLSELRLERATWQLLHVLGRDRVEEGRAEKDREGGRLVGEGASDKELADNLFKQDSSVRQAQARRYHVGVGVSNYSFCVYACEYSLWSTGWRVWLEWDWSSTQRRQPILQTLCVGRTHCMTSLIPLTLTCWSLRWYVESSSVWMTYMCGSALDIETSI